ncbi:hypothetical protein RIF29_18923 [Crotalaria pallida]|uniref:Uncharacterized protein n=1 Tax=Crotalaria pallida TaxID=3830 RepID=A0AAN9F308_CROPI
MFESHRYEEDFASKSVPTIDGVKKHYCYRPGTVALRANQRLYNSYFSAEHAWTVTQTTCLMQGRMP